MLPQAKSTLGVDIHIKVRTSMSNLITTFGPKRADELGMILPHEHVFVDLAAGQQVREVVRQPGIAAIELGTQPSDEPGRTPRTEYIDHAALGHGSTRLLRRPVITPGSARRPQCGCTAGGNRGRSAPATPTSCDLRASISAAKKLDQVEQLGALADNG